MSAIALSTHSLRRCAAGPGRAAALALLALALLLPASLGAQRADSARAHAAPAQARPDSGRSKATPAPRDSGVLLNFQDTDIRLVISSLADMAGATISYAGLPARPVTLRSSTPIPRSQLRSLLESVVRANGLTLVDEGGVLRVSAPAPEPVAPRAPAPPPAAQQGGAGEAQLYVYRLRHVRAEDAARTLKELFGLASPSRGGGLSLMPSDRGVAEREQRRERLANPFAAPAKSDSTASRTTTLSAEVRGPVQIVPDALTNALLIRSGAEDFAVLRAAIEQLDTRPLQVLIEVLIAEVRRDRQYELGLNVTVPDQEEPRSGATLGGEIKGNTSGDVALRVLGVGHVRADVVLHALASSSDIHVLSRPVLLAQNNQEARILVGTQRPFVQISRALPTDAGVRDQVIQYRDVGTQLNIKPTINPDGYVTLNLSQEVSSATTETQFGAPVISTREVQTQLFVKDDHTAVIGGLVDRQREDGNSGIPFLRSIPLLGGLFRSTHRAAATTELFLLLTPHVIRSDEELEDMTNELKERNGELKQEQLEPMIQRSTPEPLRIRKP